MKCGCRFAADGKGGEIGDSAIYGTQTAKYCRCEGEIEGMIRSSGLFVSTAAHVVIRTFVKLEIEKLQHREDTARTTVFLGEYFVRTIFNKVQIVCPFEGTFKVQVFKPVQTINLRRAWQSSRSRQLKH